MLFRKRSFIELREESLVRRGKLPLILVLHNIRSQYNVGAILRTADAVGVEKVILSGYTPKPEQSGVKKTALRGLTGVNWQYIENIYQELHQLKNAGYQVYALEQCHGSKRYDQVTYQFPSVLILGEEVDGVDLSLLDLCDQVLEIPMFGQAHSLNVSVAAGVIMYEILGQYSK